MATSADRQRSRSRFIKARRGWNPNRQLEAYLFLLPSLLGFLVFIVAPVIGSLGLSLMRWNLLSAGVCWDQQLCRDLYARPSVWSGVLEHCLLHSGDRPAPAGGRPGGGACA